MADIAQLHRRALDETRSFVARIDRAQWADATLCDGWDVQALLNHLVSGNLWAVELGSGHTIEEVGDRLDGDVLGNDALAAYDASAKAAAAYSFGFLTKKMYEAITSCRKIRNAYAHADNPDDARASKDYLKHKPRLMGLDPEHTGQSIEKFRQLHAGCTGLIGVTAEYNDVSAVMLAVCENLGSAAFFALATAELPPRVVPAFFGPDDAIQSMKDRQADKN